jgi:tRNA(Ile)-lysidine synthase TilS/MesJ
MYTKLENELIELISEANERWNLFEKGEKLVIGISGGKDSIACLNLLKHFDLELHAVYVDLHDIHDNKLKEYVSNITDYQHVSSDVLKDYKHKKNICFSCSRQRRKLLLETARDLGINKVVLGHHKDDVAETLLLNQIYSREYSTMQPKQGLFRDEYFIIRPMYLIKEQLLQYYVNQQEFPNFDLRCNYELDSKRKYVKDLIAQIQEISPKIDVVDNLFASMFNIKEDFLAK